MTINSSYHSRPAFLHFCISHRKCRSWGTQENQMWGFKHATLFIVKPSSSWSSNALNISLGTSERLQIHLAQSSWTPVPSPWVSLWQKKGSLQIVKNDPGLAQLKSSFSLCLLYHQLPNKPTSTASVIFYKCKWSKWKGWVWWLSLVSFPVNHSKNATLLSF